MSGQVYGSVPDTLQGSLNSTPFVAYDESSPVFPGGDLEMMDFVERNIHYPKDAIEKGIEGKVVVKFMVTKSGTISNISIVKSVYKSLDEEAVRVVKSFPKFKPAMRGKEPIDGSLTIPFVFSLPSKNKSDVVYIDADYIPIFPGGDEALKKFVEGSIRYPKEALDKGIQGRVFLKFTVTKDGDIRRIKVGHSVCKALDAEAIRIAKSLPKFKPGTENGVPVDKEFYLPVDFKLPSERQPKIYYDHYFHRPVFPGGEVALHKFIKDNLRYPKDALEKGIEGRVITQFTITKTGSIRNVRIVRSLYKSLDKEAIRVVKLLPSFEPGKKGGVLTDIDYTLPVNFRLPSSVETKK